uniref:protein-L-isoaspartate(D-aspartate) O-methyltransferase n=1 Tax=Physcomitrium patens TaxID=3218 RepID=A0A7I4E0N4_PHYPA
MPAMALTPAERNSSEQVQCGGPQKGCGKPLPRVGRKPFLAACAPPGTYPPAPTSPGDEMQWHCHGANYEELISNLQKRGILTSLHAAAAMSKVDRKLFVPATGYAYNDSPQVIGYGATISAPHMHSYCLSLLADHAKPGMSVLDVGSGSGYLTAVFGLMVGETGRVVGVEHIAELVEGSIDAIKETPAGELMDKGRIEVYVADGKLGYEEAGPYDCIHVGAAAAGRMSVICSLM